MKPVRRPPGTTRKLFALSLSIALAMSGVGIILPVVPSHIERLGLASGQAICGFATSLLTLYAIRLGTGIFSAAIIPPPSPLWPTRPATRIERGAWRS